MPRSACCFGSSPSATSCSGRPTRPAFSSPTPTGPICASPTTRRCGRCRARSRSHRRPSRTRLRRPRPECGSPWLMSRDISITSSWRAPTTCRSRRSSATCCEPGRPGPSIRRASCAPPSRPASYAPRVTRCAACRGPTTSSLPASGAPQARPRCRAAHGGLSRMMGRRVSASGIALLAAGAALLPLGVAAGQAAGRGRGAGALDRIVAIVGSKPILQSQVEEMLVAAQAQGQSVPTDSAGRAAARKQILLQIVEDEILIQQAERDTTVKVTDQEVQEAVEQTVRGVRGNYTNDSTFYAQLRLAGFTSVEEWRRFLAEQQRRKILRDRLLQLLREKGKLKPINPTDGQMRQFWDEQRTTQPKRPATVSVRQIVVAPRPDSAARGHARQILIAPTISSAQVALARQLADSIRVALAHGASYDSLARLYADENESNLAPEVALTDLPQAYQQLFAGDTTLGLKPVLTLASGHQTKFAVVEVTKRQPAGELSFDDVKDRIRSMLSQELMIRHYVDQLRRLTYVDIRL